MWDYFPEYYFPADAGFWKCRDIQEPDPEQNKGVIIASTVVGVIGVILAILQIAAGTALGLYAVSQPAKEQTVTEEIQEVPEDEYEEPDGCRIKRQIRMSEVHMKHLQSKDMMNLKQ